MIHFPALRTRTLVVQMKDITIVVAPERGSDLNPREVIRRVMKLAEQERLALESSAWFR